MQFVKKAFFQKPPFKVLRFYSTIMTTTNQPSMVSGNFHIVQKELPEGFTMVQEGTAKILYSSDVFYNKVQVVNRDLSILAIKMYDEMRRKENPKAEGKKHDDVVIYILRFGNFRSSFSHRYEIIESTRPS